MYFFVFMTLVGMLVWYMYVVLVHTYLVEIHQLNRGKLQFDVDPRLIWTFSVERCWLSQYRLEVDVDSGLIQFRCCMNDYYALCVVFWGTHEHQQFYQLWIKVLYQFVWMRRCDYTHTPSTILWLEFPRYFCYNSDLWISTYEQMVFLWICL